MQMWPLLGCIYLSPKSDKGLHAAQAAEVVISALVAVENSQPEVARLLLDVAAAILQAGQVQGFHSRSKCWQLLDPPAAAHEGASQTAYLHTSAPCRNHAVILQTVSHAGRAGADGHRAPLGARR
jgi:hypothetical protein